MRKALQKTAGYVSAITHVQFAYTQNEFYLWANLNSGITKVKLCQAKLQFGYALIGSRSCRG